MDKELDYSALIGFIYSNEKLGNRKKFAKYLDITEQALRNKLSGKASFTQSDILKMKLDFNLTSEQIDRYFFTPKLQKVNNEWN